MRIPVVIITACLLLGTSCSPTEETSTDNSTDSSTDTVAERVAPDDLRLNQIQMVGTHNSYHIAPVPALFAAEVEAVKQFGDAAKELGDINSLNYTHQPLTDQLESGIRSFELDIWADPVGGLFSKPLAPTLLGVPDVPLPQNMDAPGFKVLHIIDIDFGTTCTTFIACLTELRTWSDANPDHVPFIINVELKDDPLPAPLDITKVVPIDAAQLDALDAEIRSVLGEDRILTPDDVRASAETLRDAVTKNGWPELDEVRGQFMFFMDNDEHRETYLDGHPSLAGRVLFTSSGEGQDDAAVLKVNDPGDGTKIAQLVEDGYIIRTRADSNYTDAEQPESKVRDTAWDSGAQIVSTDYPIADPAESGYTVALAPGPQVRCNPKLVAVCIASDIEPD